MISNKDKKELKEELGNNYSSPVLALLKKKGAVNNHNKPYSSASIRRVFNGYDENVDIELAIYEARDEVRAKKEALKKARAAGAKSA